MSRETVIRRIVQREMQKRGLTDEMVARETPGLYRSACKEFGTWDTALKYAGIGVRHLYAKENCARNHVLQRLRKYCARNCKPTARNVMCHHRRLYDAARRHFGTWRQALHAAGTLQTVDTPPPSRRKRKWDPQTVIEHILRRQVEGKPLTYKRVKSEQSTLIWAAKKYFGGWKQALAAARAVTKAGVSKSSAATI
jgi:hypothetical protein